MSAPLLALVCQNAPSKDVDNLVMRDGLDEVGSACRDLGVDLRIRAPQIAHIWAHHHERITVLLFYSSRVIPGRMAIEYAGLCQFASLPTRQRL